MDTKLYIGGTAYMLQISDDMEVQKLAKDTMEYLKQQFTIFQTED
jgi:hypothetical protein